MLLTAAATLPLSAAALEQRFDHRDLHGPLVEALAAQDSISISGREAAVSRRAAVSAGWGFDVTGEGSELIVSLEMAFGSGYGSRGDRVRLATSGRLRSYFGTEELKTFFELGVFAPIRSRFAIGPLVGLGVAYDFSRAFGLFLEGGFSSAFGEARIITIALGAGAQARFELP